MKCFFLSGFALSLCLLLLEGVLRLAGFLPALPLDPDTVSVNGYFWISDPALGFRNRANGSYVSRDIHSRPRATTDYLGFRNGYAWDPDEGNPTVVMVGDSMVFGAEVNDVETIASHLGRLLKTEGKEATVLNAGVRGYNTVQAARMLEQRLDCFPSIRVAVYCYCDNDWFENLEPKTYWPATAPTMRWDPETQDLTEVDAPATAVAAGESFLVAVADRMERRRRRLANKRFDQRVRDRLRETSVVLHLTQKLVSNLKERRTGMLRDGHDRSSVQAYPDVELGNRAMVHVLSRMADLCARHDVHLLVTGYLEEEIETKVAGWCREAGVEFVPVSSRFPGCAQQYQARLREGGYDPHLSAHGTAVFAGAVLPAVEKALARVSYLPGSVVRK